MKLNVLLTTAFEIECRTTSTGLGAPAAAPHSALDGLTPWHFLEIEGDALLTFVTEATDA